jgi:hypothetical protein
MNFNVYDYEGMERAWRLAVPGDTITIVVQDRSSHGMMPPLPRRRCPVHGRSYEQPPEQKQEWSGCCC